MLRLTRRKLQWQNGCYYINAPKEWVKHNKLLQGDEIGVTLDNKGRIVLEPIKEATEN